MFVQLTIAAWLALEAGLLIRDRVRGQGSSGRDRETLWLNTVIIAAAVVAARNIDRRAEERRRLAVLVDRAECGRLAAGKSRMLLLGRNTRRIGHNRQ